MTEQEVEEGNQKIELHNKFCFMKKQLPMYKRIVPLRVPIMYAIISGVLICLPTMLSVAGSSIFGAGSECQVSICTTNNVESIDD